MSFTTKIHIYHDQLTLAPTLQRLDDVDVRAITHGNTAPGAAVFPFLIEYDDREQLERTLDSDGTVEAYDLIDWTDETGIYYIEFTPGTRLISTVVTDVNGFLVHTEAVRGGWLVHLLLPDREALNVIWEYATDNDISMDIIEIYSNSGTGDTVSYGLTEEQRMALKTVYEGGYFNEPRDISLNEAAAEMGLSSTAMSGRLRRGMRNLISSTLFDDEE